MRLTAYIGALLLALASTPALGQATGSSVQFPAGYAPGVSLCVKQANGTCLPVAIDNGVPIQVPANSGIATSANQVVDQAKLDALNIATACPTVTGTISALNGAVTMNCPIAGAYTVRLSTPAGQAEFNGALTAQSANGSPKRWMRTGVTALDVATIPFIGQPVGTRYYTISGGQALSVVASTYTAGQVSVSISATPHALYPIINGEVQTSSLASVLNGRSFTTGFPGGEINVPTNGQYACISVSNPATSQTRGIWEQRSISTDVLPSQRPPRFYVINNPTSGNVTTAGTIAPRGVTGPTSTMVVAYGVVAALPTAATQNGGRIPTGGVPMYVLPEKTIEPGATQVLCAQGVNPTGQIGDTSNISMPLAWREQSVN